MSWQAHRLVYKAASPIHIGWHTLGYINLTRHYIPGKNMWGAFTDSLTRTWGKDWNDYEEFGTNILNKQVLLSYFYPALDPDNPLLPNFGNTGLTYGMGETKLTRYDFESAFIKSYGQTAVLPAANTAEEASLHESEFIAPAVVHDHDGGTSQVVFFVGYLFICKDAEINKESLGWDTGMKQLKDVATEIFVGGDRKYGWGRLMLDTEKHPPQIAVVAFGRTLCLDGNDPKVSIAPQGVLPAHLKVSAGLKLKGDIEPVVGREWGEVRDREGNVKTGAGQKISKAQLCWVPGSVLLEEKGATLQIGQYGILTAGGQNG